MKILQFAFDSAEENDFIPHTYHKNCLVYTGSHDNDTSKGWFKQRRQKTNNTAWIIVKERSALSTGT